MVTRSGPESTRRIVLISRTDVSGRGVTSERWRVRHNDGWLSPEECVRRGIGQPEPRRQSLPVGCQSMFAVQLALPVGAQIEQILSEPAQATQPSVDAYLGTGRPPQPRTRRILYEVNASGQLQVVSGGSAH